MPHTGIQPRSYLSHWEAMRETITRLYRGQTTKAEQDAVLKRRDSTIRAQYQQGYTIPELAARYGLSNARVHQILCSLK